MIDKLRRLNATLGPKQRTFVHSRSKRRRIKGSRQCGKSHGIGTDIINTGFGYDPETDTLLPDATASMYVAPTSKSARNAVWSKLHELNNKYELGMHLHESRLVAMFPTGATTDFEGAHDSARVQRLRGKPLTGKLWVDEFGFFPERLARELLGPVATAMFLASPNKQRIALSSSPAPQRRGLFFELGSNANWEQHSLTLFDNPIISNPVEALADLRAATGWTEASPAYQREGLGLEVDDTTLNVYELGELNLIDSFPEGPWDTVATLDFGDSDQSAIAILGWRPHDPVLYTLYVEGWSKFDIEDLAQKLLPLLARFKPRAIFADSGGGGAQHISYLRKRHRLPIGKVMKSPNYKKPAIEEFNTDARRGLYRVLRSSPLVEQMQALQWDATERAKGNWNEHPGMANDLCFVAGTLVTTNRGDIPIEDVRAGDMALTRHGYFPVLAAALTGERETITIATSNAKTLTGTGAHPVLTSHGWLALRSIALDVTLYGCHSPHNRNTSKERTDIERCGNGTTDQYHQGTSSIIATTTSTTTRLKTLSACRADNTPSNISRMTRTVASLLQGAGSSLLGPRHLSGTDQQKAAHGIGNKLRSMARSVVARLPWIAYVSCVEPCLRGEPPKLRYVPTAATQNGGATPGQTTSNAHARSAATISPATDTKIRFVAPVRVVSAGASGKHKVYNLTVAVAHEYFANGILVSNCDVVLYGHMHAQHFRAESKPKPPPKPGTDAAWTQWSDEGLQRAHAEADEHHRRLAEVAEERAYLLGGDVDD